MVELRTQQKIANSEAKELRQKLELMKKDIAVYFKLKEEKVQAEAKITDLVAAMEALKKQVKLADTELQLVEGLLAARSTKIEECNRIRAQIKEQVNKQMFMKEYLNKQITVDEA